LNPITACLDAAYMPSNGTTASDTSLPTLISAPRGASDAAGRRASH
jgi:hypothetical protein